MTPERIATLRKHHKLGCHAVATMADVDELLAEIEQLKARLLPPSAVVLTPTEWNDQVEAHETQVSELKAEVAQLELTVCDLCEQIDDFHKILRGV